jgi:aspartyl-tRNA synthetase
MKRTLVKKTIQKVGEEVILYGFVDTVRDHGKIGFIDLRDETGIVQCVAKELPKLTDESVVKIIGKVQERPKELVNKDIKTGEVEVSIEEIEVLALAPEQLPFPIHSDGLDIDEELRLKYRYLDLRRKRLQENLRKRSEYVQAIREYLFDNDFVEIETPLLTKSTPEGSRDFVVPSRIYNGRFYALPQSPQQYKQLLMASGFEKYFQIARCIRDEDPRADRGFEHTQVDLEMAFVEREDVMRVVEEMTIHAVEKIGGKIAQKPFPIVTYEEAMEKYGADKFDLRSKEEKQEGILSFAWVVDFPFFEKDKDGNWTFTHNPFSAPLDKKSEEMLLEGKDIEKIKTSQYDLVCNGFEVAGGSIRTHKKEVLAATYKIMGYSEERIENSVGHMLEAFEKGVPPHGGCAQGVERMLMTVLGEDYLREVQAFPMTGRGRTAVMDAPSNLDKKQLEELGIVVKESSEE